jgi:hypothetical protein
MAIEIIGEQNKSVDYIKHIINFEEALNRFDIVYKGEIDDLGTKRYYSCLSDHLDGLFYKDFNNEINYVEIIRAISNVYNLMEDILFYINDSGLIEEKWIFKATYWKIY